MNENSKNTEQLNEADKKLVSLLIEKTKDNKLKWIICDACHINKQTITTYSLDKGDQFYKLNKIVMDPGVYPINSKNPSRTNYELEMFQSSNLKLPTHNIDGNENKQLSELYKLVADKVANLQSIISYLESL